MTSSFYKVGEKRFTREKIVGAGKWEIFVYLALWDVASHLPQSEQLPPNPRIEGIVLQRTSAVTLRHNPLLKPYCVGVKCKGFCQMFDRGLCLRVTAEVFAKRALKIDFLDRLWEGWDATVLHI